MNDAHNGKEGCMSRHREPWFKMKYIIEELKNEDPELAKKFANEYVTKFEETKSTLKEHHPDASNEATMMLMLDNRLNILEDGYRDGLQAVMSTIQLCQGDKDRRFKKLWYAIGGVALVISAMLVGGVDLGRKVLKGIWEVLT